MTQMDAEDIAFKLVSGFDPTGDQPSAIAALIRGFQQGKTEQVLLGVTGSGKTFTMAHLVVALGLPTLVIAHNKTLAAQLFQEFKGFFPENAVEYFVSYYDYYQPEAYIPSSDTFIEKDAQINDELDRLRLSATSSLMTRRDVLIVASVSCIYGLGSPEEYRDSTITLEVGQEVQRREILEALVRIYYQRTPSELERGKFRVRGDVIDVFPAYATHVVRIHLWGDQIEKIAWIDPVSGRSTRSLSKCVILPSKHFVTSEERTKRACQGIAVELEDRLKGLHSQGKLLEAQRLEMRTRFDLEILGEIGTCAGIENYSRHFSGRAQGEPPECLLDYFPKPFLTIIDESHATLPQLRGMVLGDRSRKTTLVEHGFRLPSALDNRPQTFEEFCSKVGQVLYVSATPAAYELGRTGGEVVEQIIRPTGLVDPVIEVRPAEGQVDDLIGQIKARVDCHQRVLVTTLTKRMAEDLTEYLLHLGIRVRYLHSDIDTIERVEILRDLRKAVFDVLVGINLLREGLDLPEVTLVAILDADQEGFLRSETSIIQTAGRAARNVDGKVILYASRVTDSMKRAISESSRRRTMQVEYNQAHDITPKTVEKEIKDLIEIQKKSAVLSVKVGIPEEMDEKGKARLITDLEREMFEAAEELEFERAAALRDQIKALKDS